MIKSTGNLTKDQTLLRSPTIHMCCYLITLYNSKLHVKHQPKENSEGEIK